MSERLQGKRILVVGGATGIGAASALSCAREGASVVVGDINADAGEELVRQIGDSASFLKVDVGQESEVADTVNAAADRLSGLDSLVYVAGVQRAGRVDEFPVELFDLTLAVNLRGMFLAAKHAVPHLRKAGGGSIVNISSLAGIKGGPGMTIYSASKGGVNAFTKALSAELGPDQIRVNAICPGWIDTPFNAPIIDFIGGVEARERLIKEVVPLGRQGAPEEIALAVVYLASNESSYTTGHFMVIDGGLS